jgi:sugar phosphate isomerase/epimerase
MPAFQNSRLLLSAGTLPHATFTERVEAARYAGYNAISLFPAQYLRAIRKERLGPEDMRDILAANGISVDEIDPLLDWFGPTPSPSEELIFEIASQLGARSINAPSAYAPDITLAQLTDALRRLAQRAQKKGLRIDLEFLPWTLVPDLQTALQVVKDTGQENVGVMLDCWHFFRGGDTIETAQNLSPDQAKRITSLQVNDAPSVKQPLNWRNRLALVKAMITELIDGIRVSGVSKFFKASSAMHATRPDAMELMQEAISARLLPGRGEMPVAELLKMLEQVGCEPTVGLEVFSLDLARLPAEEIASRTIAAYNMLCRSGSPAAS